MPEGKVMLPPLPSSSSCALREARGIVLLAPMAPALVIFTIPSSIFMSEKLFAGLLSTNVP